MSNPFSVLHNEEPEETTDNPQRKLQKLIRENEKNPTSEKEKRIKEMRARLNPEINPNNNKKKPKHKSTKKKKQQEEKERLREKRLQEKREKNEKSQEEERRMQTEYEQRQQIFREKQREMEREKAIKREEQRKNEFKKQQEEKQQKRKREKQNAFLRINEKTRSKLPQDIKNFIDDQPDKKTYHKLSKIYHPDKGGDTELFKIISNHASLI